MWFSTLQPHPTGSDEWNLCRPQLCPVTVFSEVESARIDGRLTSNSIGQVNSQHAFKSCKDSSKLIQHPGARCVLHVLFSFISCRMIDVFCFSICVSSRHKACDYNKNPICCSCDRSETFLAHISAVAKDGEHAATGFAKGSVSTYTIYDVS